MKLREESQLLDVKFRKSVIDEIVGPENVKRKNAALRAYEIFNGQTKKWVIELLMREFDPETVAQMENRATNISILRKVVTKLSNTYTPGVIRKVDEDKADTTAAEGGAGATQEAPAVPDSQADLDALLTELGFDQVQDKADRFYELFRNSLVSTVPIRNYRESATGSDKYDLAIRVLPPHLYDVIEDDSNPEVPRVVILTDFVERNQSVATGTGPDGRQGVVPNVASGDGKDQIIADSVDDAGTDNREFIFWSDKYHFTCKRNGEIVAGKSEPGNVNPLGELPFVVYAGDQDGSYYSSNWEDKVDGAIHVNVALTDMFCIAMVQGWGQPVLTGEKLPEKVKGGPHRAIMLKQEQGSPEAKFYYATSTPPLDQWMAMIELEVAMYLSTNNLSPTTVSSKLDVQHMASGIAMMIERSESTADITKKHKMFQDGEQETVRKVSQWQKLLGAKQALTERFQALNRLDGVSFTTTFLPAKPVISEKEHVETLKARKDLGLNTTLELIMIDNPNLTEDQAKQKLEAIKEEKKANADEFGSPVGPDGKPLDPHDPNEPEPNQADDGDPSN